MKNSFFVVVALITLSLYSCAVKPAQGTRKSTMKSTSKLYVIGENLCKVA